MPKINVYLPDELAEAVRESGVPVSAVCQRALEQAVRRITAIRESVLTDLDDADLATLLPNFTARARTVLSLAGQQARAEGAPAVGSGHLLGGLLAEGDNLALRVLRAVEIEPDRVRRQLARQRTAEPPAAGTAPGPAGAPPDGQPDAAVAAAPGQPGGAPARHFSGAAANALELAVTEATAFGHNYIGGEHLLLGLIAEPDGVAGQVLRSLGAELRLTRRAVAAALAGYVHLRAQTGQGAPAAQPDSSAVLAALRQELAPLVRRIELLEERVGLAARE